MDGYNNWDGLAKQDKYGLQSVGGTVEKNCGMMKFTTSELWVFIKKMLVKSSVLRFIYGMLISKKISPV